MSLLAGKKKIAVHLHLHFTDLLHYFIKHLNNMPFSYKLYITVTDGKKLEYVRRTCARHLKASVAQVMLIENRGRDVKPFYVDLQNELVKYDYVCHLHSKKSVYNNGATRGWLEHLTESLLGSEEIITSIFEKFENNAQVGLIYPVTYSKLPYWAHQWLSNTGYAHQFQTKLKIKELPKGYFSYPVGNMFWARIETIKPIFDLRLKNEDFLPENGATDGTIQHALERIISVLATDRGYKNISVTLNEKAGVTFQDADDSISFSGYHDNSLDILKRRIQSPNIKVVSFDVFDTLVYRPLLEPDDLFDLMEPEVTNIVGKKVEFRSIRTRADGAVRSRLKPGFDVTLDSIYKEIASVLNIDSNASEKIKNIEIDYEKRILRKRSPVAEILEFAFDARKKVILTSDMYLSKDTLKLLLQNLGITAYHHIYISSEVGYRKDARTLFPYILQKENLRPGELLHVGDNEHSDIQVAQDIGISVFHVKKPKDLFLQTNLAKTIYKRGFKNMSPYSRIALAMGINKCFNDPFPKTQSLVNGNLETFGYFYMGPLLLTFIKWIAETANQEHINKLLFLSRDGEILYKIYQILGKFSSQKLPKAEYIEISRQSLAMPFINDENDINKVLKADYYGDTLQNFFYIRFGIDISYLTSGTLKNFGFSGLDTKIFMPTDFEKIKPLANYLFESNKKIYKAKRKNALKYLKEKKLFDNSNKAIVDIGYSGTMQKFLNNIAGKPIHGLYMVTYNTIQANIGKPDVFTKALFGDNIDAFAKNLVIDKYSLFYEMILSSVKGPVKYYKINRGKPQPIYENVAWEEREKVKKLPLIHNGILNFCNDFLSMFNNVDVVPHKELNLLQEPFRHFIEQPAPEDIIMLSGYSLDDYYCGNRIFYWVPTQAELQDKSYDPHKFLWRQALNKINAENINTINHLFHLQNLRFGHSLNQHFDTPRDKEIFDWYQSEFEALPSWYKKISKVIQLAKGTKKIKIVLVDKKQHQKFNSKAEEIQDWYNREYESMPGWYKKTGHLIKIITGQKSIREYLKKSSQN